jgi:hypothetical protein
LARSAFFQVRVAVLLAILLIVLLYAWQDISERRDRASFRRPLDVAVVLLQYGPRDAGTAAAIVQLQQRVNALQDTLFSEQRRYRSEAEPLLRLSAYGPVPVLREPPAPTSESFWDAAVHTYELWRYTRAVDAAVQLPSRAFDSRIYVLVEPVQSQARKLVEGFSEQGGRVGVARVQLDASTVDLGLFVVAHELMHTLGATDKYTADGTTQIPAGLGDPEQSPLYPQRRAEVMARNRVVSPGHELIPDALGELSVGSTTAREIGWTQ